MQKLFLLAVIALSCVAYALPQSDVQAVEQDPYMMSTPKSPKMSTPKTPKMSIPKTPKTPKMGGTTPKAPKTPKTGGKIATKHSSSTGTAAPKTNPTPVATLPSHPTEKLRIPIVSSPSPMRVGDPYNTNTNSNGATCAKFADANYLCSAAACTSKVAVGSGQSNYQCAEFVSRSIASTGKIPNLTSGAAQSAYNNYQYKGKTYDLLWTSHRTGGPLGLEDFLIAAGWKSGGSVKDCSVVFVDGAEGAWSHVAVGIGTNLLDAHNNARYHVATSYYTVNAVYNQS